MCAHLRPKSRRIAAVGLRNTSLRLGVRGDQPGYSNVRAVLRHFVPYKGLHPLRCLRHLSQRTLRVAQFADANSATHKVLNMFP